EVEVGLQRRLRRELQVDPLIICLVQPAPAGSPAYKGQADAEPDTRPSPKVRQGGRDRVRETGSEAPRPRPEPAAAINASKPPAQAEEPELEAGRTRRRRSAALAG
ncbi:MAG: ribonuclease J, partial [Cyanobacteriota bacterium]|nr:ribonuclease J [Cyanobacteriota bacterium]